MDKTKLKHFNVRYAGCKGNHRFLVEVTWRKLAVGIKLVEGKF